MSWIEAAIALVPVVVLLAQGLYCIGRWRDGAPVGLFGILALVLGVTAAGLGLLSLGGTLIPSYEIGILLAQGALGQAALILAVLGFSVAGAVGSLVVRARRRWPLHARWVVIAATVVVGLFLLSGQLRALNPFDPWQVRVYRYDLLWPPLLVGLACCLAEAAAGILGAGRLVVRTWLVATVIAVLAWWARRQPRALDADWGALWTWIFAASFAVSLGIATSTVLGLGGRPERMRRRLASVVAAAAVACALWRGGALVGDAWSPLALVLVSAPWLVFVWPAFVGVVGIRSWSAGPVAPPTARQTAGFLALAAACCALVDLFYFSVLNPAVDVAVFTTGWIVLAAVAIGDVFTTLLERIRSGAGPGQPNAAGETPPAAAPAPAPAPAPAAAALLAGLSAWLPTTWSKTLLSLFVALVLLLLVNEGMNAGKTLIEPFGSAPKDSELGRLVAERLFNEVGLLELALRPEGVRLLPHAEEGGPSFRLMRGSGTASVDAALAKAADVEIVTGVKIAPSLLLAPVREPLRRWLGVREIGGTVQKLPAGIAVLAHSNRGETWRVETKETDEVAALAAVAGELAFLIVSSPDSTFSVAGLTGSHDAFKQFRTGVDSWLKIESEPDALRTAIQAFRHAVKVHPGFALAHHRLGLALRRVGDPAAAVAAFRAAIRANPELVAAYIALASTLYDLNLYAETLPVVEAPAPAPAAPAAHTGEAVRLWHQVVGVRRGAAHTLDVASAYYGLCRHVIEGQVLVPAAADDWRHLAFYYCKRAERLYATLPAATRERPNIKEAEASVLNSVGDVFAVRAAVVPSRPSLGWCLDQQIARTPYTAAAFEYYSQAAELFPSSAVFRCNAAGAADALQSPILIGALARHPMARAGRGERLRRAAAAERDTAARSSLYRRALAEYEEGSAIGTSWEVLHGYARAFWEWRARHPQESVEPRLAEQVEMAARTAVLLASGLGTEPLAASQTDLGLVLLSLGRPHETIDALKPVEQDDLASSATLWALAQAYICASVRDHVKGAPDAETRRLRESGPPLAATILRREWGREFRPFTQSATLDVQYSVAACTADRVLATPTAAGRPWYALRGNASSASGGMPCTEARVQAAAFEGDGGSARDVRLRVWGWSLNERMMPSAISPDGRAAGLPLRGPSRARAYFAQLENPERVPLSEVVEFDVPAAESANRCRRNLVTLVFDRLR
jgi:tetratricopeptide (TPR) repeat protein